VPLPGVPPHRLLSPTGGEETVRGLFPLANATNFRDSTLACLCLPFVRIPIIRQNIRCW
jgi:hypothetical protein